MVAFEYENALPPKFSRCPIPPGLPVLSKNAAILQVTKHDTDIRTAVDRIPTLEYPLVYLHSPHQFPRDFPQQEIKSHFLDIGPMFNLICHRDEIENSPIVLAVTG
jgi:hypothetical protein